MRAFACIVTALALAAPSAARGQDASPNQGSPGSAPWTAPAIAPAATPPAPPPTPPPPPAYPPGYPSYPAYPGYPAGYPVYPAYPGYAQPYPGYGPPQNLAAAAPAPVPTGKWRFGGAMILFPTGRVSYSLDYRGETILPISGDTSAAAGISVFGEYQLMRWVFVGAAVQLIPSVKWSNPPDSEASGVGGAGREVDFLPQVGVTVPVARRLTVLAYGAPGYSLIDVSNMARLYADPGTAKGFVVQTGAGLTIALGEHAFLQLRGTYQWGYQSNQVQSATTSAKADVVVRSQFLGLHAAGGGWF